MNAPLKKPMDGRRFPAAPRAPMGEPWCPPALTPEQQKAQDEYVAKHNLPF